LPEGVRDEKMLKKLTTHDIWDVAELFCLADKYARAAEGHAWHSSPGHGFLYSKFISVIEIHL
jgi:hypothetical protein